MWFCRQPGGPLPCASVRFGVRTGVKWVVSYQTHPRTDQGPSSGRPCRMASGRRWVVRTKIVKEMEGTAGQRGRLCGCIAAAGVLLSACGTAPARSIQATSPLTTSAVTPSGSDNPADAAVVAAYLSATRAFVHAGTTMDPNDPALLATMTGEELSTVKKNLIIDRAAGLVARGDITPMHPHIVSDDHQTAVLRDCQYSAVLLVNAKTGTGAPGVANGPQNIGVTATLMLLGASWKVSLEDLKVGSCPLGY